MALLVGSPQHVTDSIHDQVQWLKEAAYVVDHTTEGTVVVDFASVESICSEELNELIRLNTQLRNQSRDLVIDNVQDQVWQVFSVTRLDRLLKIRRAEGVDLPVTS